MRVMRASRTGALLVAVVVSLVSMGCGAWPGGEGLGGKDLQCDYVDGCDVRDEALAWGWAYHLGHLGICFFRGGNGPLVGRQSS